MLRSIKYKLRRAIFNIVEEVLVGKSQDIDFFLQLKSLESTARYVTDNLQSAKKFNNKMKLLEFALTAAQAPGLFCEFGVYRGESIRFIADQIRPRRIHGFDSFEGLPGKWRGGFEKNAFSLAGFMPEVPHNVVLHKGLFEDTLPGFTMTNNEKVAFLHVDCDLYASTKTIFSFLHSWFQEGTIIVFDEYFNYPSWELHEFKAFQEMVREQGITYEYIAYNGKHEQVAVQLK